MQTGSRTILYRFARPTKTSRGAGLQDDIVAGYFGNAKCNLPVLPPPLLSACCYEFVKRVSQRAQ